MNNNLSRFSGNTFPSGFPRILNFQLLQFKGITHDVFCCVGQNRHSILSYFKYRICLPLWRRLIITCGCLHRIESSFLSFFKWMNAHLNTGWRWREINSIWRSWHNSLQVHLQVPQILPHDYPMGYPIWGTPPFPPTQFYRIRIRITCRPNKQV